MQPSKATLQREYLHMFWETCGRGSKQPISRLKKGKTIETLVLLSETVISKRVSLSTQVARKKFERVKRYRHSLSSHPICFACRGVGEVRHHIIQIQHGGLNSKKNLVTLCKGCHAEVHPWLK